MKRLVLALLLATSCGYRFTAPGGPLPQGIRAVQAPVLSNVTAEPSAETLFTQSLREQLIRAGTLGGDDADARIEGTITAVYQAPMLATPGKAPSYRLTASVELRLVKNGAVIGAANVNGEEDVLSGIAGGDLSMLGTEANRQAGLKRLADSMMREGYERLCSGW